MNTNLSKVFIFALGATVGSLVTWKFVEEKYKKIADEEIESVIERFKNKRNTKTEITSEGITMYDVDENKPLFTFTEGVKTTDAEIEETNKILEDAGYTVATPPVREFIKPYVITPEEYGEFGNDTKSWTLYTDGVITDEHGELVSDPESMIGDALDHLGEHEDDSVHVRDENIECDYEIIKVEESFSDLNKEDN